MSATVLFWLVVYQVKHFLADYPLQGRWMLGKFKPGWSFVGPLAAHAGVHAAMTTGIALAIAPRLWWLGLVDGAVHFIVDRIKASPRMAGRWKPLTAETYPGASAQQLRGNKLFWWALGVDQMAHHLTHYAILFALLRAS